MSKSKKIKEIKPRKISTLLRILKDNARVSIKKSWFGLKTENVISDGLCKEICYLRQGGIITREETDFLTDYITDNMPYYDKNDSYGWQPKLWQPRLEWLEEKIYSISN